MASVEGGDSNGAKVVEDWASGPKGLPQTTATANIKVKTENLSILYKLFVNTIFCIKTTC